MARSAQRRNSMDFWADFDVLISLLEENRHHMEDQVRELGLIHNTQLEWTECCGGAEIVERMRYAYAALWLLYLVDEFSSPQPSALAKLTAGVAVIYLGKVCFEKLRRFLDQKKAETLLARLLARLQETMAALEETMAALEETMEAVEETMEAVEEKMEAVEEKMEAVEEKMEAVEEKMEAVEEKMEAVEASLKNRRICRDVLLRARSEVKALSSTVQQFRSGSFNWILLLKVTEQSERTVEQMELLCENLELMRTDRNI